MKDQAGFIVNALLFPYLNNAVRLLEQGVATKEGIDAAMKGGCGFPMGPFALLDLVGLDTSLAILDALYEEYRDPNYAAVPLLRRLVTSGPARPQDQEGLLRLQPLARGARAGNPGRMVVRPTPSGGDVNGDRPAAQRDAPWVMRTYSGHSTARASNELYRTNLAKGQTGLSIAFDLPTQTGYDPDAPEAAGEVGKVGVPVAHLGHMKELLEGIPVENMNTSMTINATAAWLLALYVAPCPGPGRRPGAAVGHDAERHRQGVSQPRDLHLPARTEPAAHRGHHRLHRAPRAQVEPDQRLQLPPAGGGFDAGAGDRLRAGHRHRRARRRAGLGQDRRVRAARRGRSHQLLRERRRPLRRGDLQNAGLQPAVGPHLPRALRRRGPQAPPLPLRRAGELPRADRAAAGEQRAAHRPGVARRHPLQERPGPGAAAAGLERGARVAAAVGPAVVLADAAGAGLRVRPARVRRHLRGIGRDRGQDGRAGRGRHGGAGRRGGARRGLRGDRRAEAPARAQPGRAGPAHRVGPAEGGRRQLLHRDRALTAAR